MEIKKWIKISNWRARNVRNATTPMTTTTTTTTKTKRANRNRNYTKSNSEFEIQINFCLRVLNLTFSICFMQMMQFFLFRCCCYYYWCCCCTFVVVLFVFSIPLAFACWPRRSGSRRHDLSGKSSMLNWRSFSVW